MEEFKAFYRYKLNYASFAQKYANKHARVPAHLGGERAHIDVNQKTLAHTHTRIGKIEVFISST